MTDKSNYSRRRFLTSAAAVGAVGVIGANALVSCAEKQKAVELNLPPLLDQAPDGKPIKAGVIGCGGRGSGAALDFLNAGPNLVIHALGDVFQDRIDDCRKKLKDQANHEVPDENIFLGFDAFEKVIDSGVDLVILATPPHFRPQHFEAAVQARKHVFMEKPVAVDPVGIRSVMATAKKAESLDLKIVTGTQRRHQRDYIEVYKQVANGAIGEIVSANCYWNQSKLWHRNPNADWSEMEYMIRDWVNWLWLSGDHIVEQHIHNIDVINWFSGKHPTKAVAFGSRQRRVTGDQFDNFSVDFTYDDKMHTHSMCRQINGCVNNVSEFVMGTKGSSNCKNTIWDATGAELYKYPYPLDENGQPERNVKISPYVQEHIDLVTCIRQNISVNEAEQTAITNLCAIMGRTSAYTGKEVTYEELMNSDVKLGPDKYIMGDVGIVPNAKVPVPGEAAE
ncbi:Gfo/Idh/MocA family oxidoreductase [Sunxiuqinia elliptica]|uniref:Secreted protein n=1 Tax=Sunxiuqinia elliptica TaxID=655355 RepID=A0A4R6H5Q7_9BACT|nr:Gfo/Idh/MocA family oxidoreductase [Sunxiuqinia elliptica]TDO02806.1 secreted protein [Sunxiuqinia elliptica]TDO58455.1 secreted protein [Sunxiuqinia elliptica]